PAGPENRAGRRGFLVYQAFPVRGDYGALLRVVERRYRALVRDGPGIRGRLAHRDGVGLRGPAGALSPDGRALGAAARSAAAGRGAGGPPVYRRAGLLPVPGGAGR